MTEETKKKRNKNIIISVISIAVIAAVAYYLFTPGSGQGGPGGQPGAGGPPGGGGGVKVEAVKAVTDTLTQNANVVGTLISNESVVISSEISGRVVDIPFSEGKEIKKGDLLFKLDDAVQKAALGQARANYALAQNNVKRYSGLVGSGAISKVQFEQAQADLSLAEANIALAQANLDKTTIRAPFAGTAGIRQVSVGDVVSNGQKLTNLEQTSPIRVQFTVAEKYLTELQTGRKILISSEAYPDEKFEAEVFAIDPRIDPMTRSVSIQATTPNAEKKLFSGQFVSVILPLKQNKDVVVIPDQALIPSGKGTTVFTVVNGKAKMTPVEVGLRTNNKAEIISGVKAGDTVVTAGHQKLQDGAPVRVAEPTFVQTSPASEEQQKTAE